MCMRCAVLCVCLRKNFNCFVALSVCEYLELCGVFVYEMVILIEYFRRDCVCHIYIQWKWYLKVEDQRHLPTNPLAPFASILYCPCDEADSRRSLLFENIHSNSTSDGSACTRQCTPIDSSSDAPTILTVCVAHTGASEMVNKKDV